ncbi:hypothetical protein [Amaricoccus sp.]|uniref:hypothetical protein n=1 Tax=Amaricoccus sp. TaxID=1872485 RepID=UPI001B5E8281|nr:hypothetical protein [Amaricoccus sp.]MBP7002322.1 hypothetical protein [Amaricoccus sp.]
MPRLKIAYNAEHTRPPQEPPPGACWQAPAWWVPHTGVLHGDTVLGVRWFCTRCGITGPRTFGTAKQIISLSLRSKVAFAEMAEVGGRCPTWSEGTAQGAIPEAWREIETVILGEPRSATEPQPLPSMPARQRTPGRLLHR